MQEQVTRNLEQAITQKEHARTEAKRSRTESEIGIHLERRKTYVNSVEPCHDVEDKQKWNQPARNFGMVAMARSGGSVERGWICSAEKRTLKAAYLKTGEPRITKETPLQNEERVAIRHDDFNLISWRADFQNHA